MVLRRRKGNPERRTASKLRETSARAERGLIHLQQTCEACPEQYEAFIDGERVAYLRLRHGNFAVEYLECGGETIYEAPPQGQGRFRDEERDHYLRSALDAIYNRLLTDG